MGIFVKNGGIIREMRDGYCRVGGVIRPIKEIYTRYNNVIEKVWPVGGSVQLSPVTIFVASLATANSNGMAAAIRFGSDGTISEGSNTDGTSIPSFTTHSSSPWISPTGADVGTPYEIQFAQGTLSGGTVPTFSLARAPTWHSLAGNVDMILTIPTGVRACLWETTVSIRQGLTVLSTADLSISMEIF